MGGGGGAGRGDVEERYGKSTFGGSFFERHIACKVEWREGGWEEGSEEGGEGGGEVGAGL